MCVCFQQFSAKKVQVLTRFQQCPAELLTQNISAILKESRCPLFTFLDFPLGSCCLLALFLNSGSKQLLWRSGPYMLNLRAGQESDPLHASVGPQLCRTSPFVPITASFEHQVHQLCKEMQAYPLAVVPLFFLLHSFVPFSIKRYVFLAYVW